MVVIGVTGGLGTGKSTVAGMFRQLGAVVLDADTIAHQVMEPKRLAWRQIVDTFGPGILNEDLTVNRQRLAAIVFHDEERRRRLEQIIHPRVLREFRAGVRRATRSRRAPAVVLDVPLLVEAGARHLVEALVVVTAPPDVQRERLRAQHGWSDADIGARMGAQWELSAKVALADYVVDNSDGVGATRTQVKRIWNQLALGRSKPRSRNSTSRR